MVNVETSVLEAFDEWSWSMTGNFTWSKFDRTSKAYMPMRLVYIANIKYASVSSDTTFRSQIFSQLFLAHAAAPSDSEFWAQVGPGYADFASVLCSRAVVCKPMPKTSFEMMQEFFDAPWSRCHR